MLRFNKKALPFMVFSLVLVTGATALLPGCGFRLRGAVELPPSLSTIAIEGTTQHSELGRVLYRSLQRGGVTIVPTAEAALRLQILRDEVQRRVLSVDATGKANEYELKHLLRYSAVDDRGAILVEAQDITMVRAYRFDPNNLLAMGDEEKKLRQTVILSSTQQLLRQLSAAMRRHAAPPTPAPDSQAPATPVEPRNPGEVAPAVP